MSFISQDAVTEQLQIIFIHDFVRVKCQLFKIYEAIIYNVLICVHF